uniref:Core-binding (CB) domain-containing protein n=1 Tax=Poecilia formosa TaxID=48698 RepID=A0A096M2N4_POEFO
ILSSLAPRTLSAYLSSWNQLKSFLAIYILPIPSFDISTICLFITYSHVVLKIRSSTIQSYLSGINFFFKLSAGTSCPSFFNFYINMLIKIYILSRCILTLCSGYLSNLIDRILEDIFLKAFFCFLRYSEFAPTSPTHNPLIHPSLSDLSIHSYDTLIFNLRRSKTDQFAISCPIYLFRLNSFLSPYEPIQNYVQSRFAANASPHNLLFISDSGKLASRSWFSLHFCQVLLKSGISPDHYSIHS